MKLKFNFGTGITIFMILFMAAIISFVLFAHRQDVNLVHRNYYEKGTDHTRQMQKDARSAAFTDQIEITDDGNFIRIVFQPGLASTVKTGEISFYRPSDHLKDITLPLQLRGNVFLYDKTGMIPGRYITGIRWTAGELDYEVNKPFIVK
jgi:nitrogen fixation protein FixH